MPAPVNEAQDDNNNNNVQVDNNVQVSKANSDALLNPHFGKLAIIEGHVTTDNYDTVCKKEGIAPKKSVFLFPGNLGHNPTPTISWQGAGLAEVATSLGKKGYNSLGLPTTFVLADGETVAGIQHPYYKGLYEAMGRGDNFVLPVRKTDKAIQTANDDEKDYPYYVEANTQKFLPELDDFQQAVKDYKNDQTLELEPSFFLGVQSELASHHREAAKLHLQELTKVVRCMHELKNAKTQEDAVQILESHQVDPDYIEAFKAGMDKQLNVDSGVHLQATIDIAKLEANIQKINNSGTKYQAKLISQENNTETAVVQVTNLKDNNKTTFTATKTELVSQVEPDNATVAAMVDLYREQTTGNILKLKNTTFVTDKDNRSQITVLFVRSAKLNMVPDSNAVNAYYGGAAGYIDLIQSKLTDDEIQAFNGVLQSLPDEHPLHGKALTSTKEKKEKNSRVLLSTDNKNVDNNSIHSVVASNDNVEDTETKLDEEPRKPILFVTVDKDTNEYKNIQLIAEDVADRIDDDTIKHYSIPVLGTIGDAEKLVTFARHFNKESEPFVTTYIPSELSYEEKNGAILIVYKQGSWHDKLELNNVQLIRRSEMSTSIEGDAGMSNIDRIADFTNLNSSHIDLDNFIELYNQDMPNYPIDSKKMKAKINNDPINVPAVVKPVDNNNNNHNTEQNHMKF